MKTYQQAVFLFKDEMGRKLGELKLRAKHKGSRYPQVEAQGLTCDNVPQVDSPTEKNFIEYCNLEPLQGLSRIMLLEETNYDVLFKAEGSSTVTEFLPDLNKDIFSQNLFCEAKNKKEGNLNFGSYVGRTYFSVEVDGKQSQRIPIEIRSKKLGYADEYSEMMTDLSEDCSALIYDLRSPVHQLFRFSDIKRKTLYEDFLFLEYLYKEWNLPMAYCKIKESPKTILRFEKNLVPLGQAQSIDPNDLMDIVSMSQYLAKADNTFTNWPSNMRGYIPLEINETRSVETMDIPENRFVKFFLEQIYDLILRLQKTFSSEGYIKDRLQYFIEEITDYLNDEWLKEIGPLTSLPMNSQTLQKQEGYRDLYFLYLNFEFAFRFKWEDLEDNLKASEKRMTQLYEYWCFFRLLESLKKIAKIETNESNLIQLTKSGWEIKLKQGKRSKIRFTYIDRDNNKHLLYLYYNRGFSRQGKQESRSYSLPFRPDYTIVYNSPNSSNPSYIHFDAKYRSEEELQDFSFIDEEKQQEENAEDLTDLEINEIDKIKKEESSRKYKNADIYKMHTYKDAILYSLGSFVLYPGEKEGVFKVDDDFEIPAIGAIPLKPNDNNDIFFGKIDKIIEGLIKL